MTVNGVQGCKKISGKNDVGVKGILGDDLMDGHNSYYMEVLLWEW